MVLQTKNAVTFCTHEFHRAPLSIMYGLHLAVLHMEVQDCYFCHIGCVLSSGLFTKGYVCPRFVELLLPHYLSAESQLFTM